jgi:hypothetical protein
MKELKNVYKRSLKDFVLSYHCTAHKSVNKEKFMQIIHLMKLLNNVYKQSSRIWSLNIHLMKELKNVYKRAVRHSVLFTALPTDSLYDYGFGGPFIASPMLAETKSAAGPALFEGIERVRTFFPETWLWDMVLIG